MIEVHDEKALPGPKPGSMIYYVRHLIDPTVLIHGMTGDCYVRRDGKPWEWPAYESHSKVNLETGAETRTFKHRMGWFDDVRHPYKVSAAA